ncbi:MAG: UDP-N-acetylmuramate--L-alanine ligase [bacterium]|nr:UDP-N-acetylmuramate--L-alanine ligase [bacterium]
MRVHFVGVGGVGLSAMARVLIERGFAVSGSDRAANVYTDALRRDGAAISIGHDAAHIAAADLVIVTSAVNAENPEIAAARARGIPVYKRADIIMDVIGAGLPPDEAQRPFVIAIAGTHGKTTTTGMIAHMLIESGLNPGYIIGGTLSTTGTNGAAGAGRLFVIEADEYDNMFHGLRYDLAVITNVEWDHPDFFRTEDALFESFRRFLVGSRTAKAHVALCGDDRGAARLYNMVDDHAIGIRTYGSGTMTDLRLEADGTAIFRLAGTDITMRLALPGMHNLLNALGALQALFMLHGFFARIDQATLERAAAALATFKGTGRRFERMGEMGGVIVINDYAHHPTAIRATLAAARERFPGHALWAVWQPHTYSRTRALWDTYLVAFDQADHALVTDIFAAREAPEAGITAARFVDELARLHPSAHHAASLDDAARHLIESVQPPAVIVIMSAGDAPKIGDLFLRGRVEGA